MVTIKELAKLAGVSRGTVDRVLNNRPGVKPDTAAEIRRIADELGYAPNLAGQILAARKKNLRLGFIVLDGPEYAYFHDVTQGARKKAAELDALGVEVKFYLVREFGTAFLEGLLAQAEGDNLDGIAMIPMMAPPIVTFMRRMNAKGVPLVFFNMDEESIDHLCYVGCDYSKAGRVAAGLAALATGAKGTVGILTLHDVGNQSYQDRVDSFIRELGHNYPAMKLLGGGEATIFQHDDYSSVYALFRDHPELDAVYIVNLGDYSICQIAHDAAAGRRLNIITNDLIPAQREMLHKGIISATLGQQPEMQGALPLQMLYTYLAFGNPPEEHVYHTNLDIYISQNV